MWGHSHGHCEHGHHGHASNYWGSNCWNSGSGNCWGNTSHGNCWGTNIPTRGFCNMNYSSGWNPNLQDQMLRNNIEQVYQQYDFNRSGQLEGQEFFNAYRDLCLKMGTTAPSSYQQLWGATQQCDQNQDSRVSKWEMFNLFKRLQGVQGQLL